MRDVIIVAIVMLAAVLALRRPWIGVLSWTWLSIMNPHRFAYGFSYDAPLAAIAAGSTLVGLLATRERDSPFKGAPVAWLNFEQDLGIPGFRRSKMSYRPAALLSKLRLAPVA